MLIVLNHKANIHHAVVEIPPSQSLLSWLSVFPWSQWLLEPPIPTFPQAKSSPVSTSTEPQALEGKAQARKALQTSAESPSQQHLHGDLPTSLGSRFLRRPRAAFTSSSEEGGGEQAWKLSDKTKAGPARAFPYVRGAMGWFPTPLWPKECGSPRKRIPVESGTCVGWPRE